MLTPAEWHALRRAHDHAEERLDLRSAQVCVMLGNSGLGSRKRDGQPWRLEDFMPRRAAAQPKKRMSLEDQIAFFKLYAAACAPPEVTNG